MPEREPQTFLNKLNENFKAVGRRVAYPASAGILAIAAACFGGDDSKVDDQTTVTPQKTRVERTFTPSTSPTEEATLVVTVLPTPEPTLEPTTVYVPPLVTPRPILRPTPIPTPVMIRPTLEPTPVPTPTPIPLEVCNTGKFTNPVDGQTVSTRVDVKAQLAHDGDFDQGCEVDLGTTGVQAVVLDNNGRRWPWALYCGYTYPISQPDWECFRNGVILSSYDQPGNDLELEVGGRVVDGVELNY